MCRIWFFAALSVLLLNGQTPAAKGKRKALVIGNAVYQRLPALATTAHDARAVGDVISKTGFSVVFSENADKRQLVAAIDSFLATLEPADTVFVYYSGYAVQSEGENLLLPVTFNPKSPDAVDDGYSVRRLQDALVKKQVGLKIIVLDAAYSSPELAQLAINPGLASPFVGNESLVALPTLPGRTIAVKPGQTEGLFVSKLLAVLQKPGLTSEQVFDQVARDVRTETKGDEAPAQFANVLGTFYFRDPLPVEVVKKVETAFTNQKDTLAYRLIPAGSFAMGCVAGDTNCAGDETKHQVTISHEFWMGATEVPVSAYRVYAAREKVRVPLLEMLDKKTQKRLKMNIFEREDAPIINVTWQDAKNFCTASGGRLPTEAEWEYAARGGVAGKIYPWGDKLTHADANFVGTEGYDVWQLNAPVDSFPPNAYGLFNMPGNALEWVEDFYDASYYGKPEAAKDPKGPSSGAERVARGGSAQSNPTALRSSARAHFPAGEARTDLGFRCVLDQKPAAK